MPTILTHAALPLALGIACGRRLVPTRLLLAGMGAAVLPDLDVLAFRFHVAYANAFGHRGFSHSLLFALVLGLLAAAAAPRWHLGRRGAGVFIGCAAMSHGLLDTLTNGGLGVALLWPWSAQRFFAPWQVIEVSPLSLGRLLGARGLAVIRSELLWVWLPALLVGALALALRRWRAATPAPSVAAD